MLQNWRPCGNMSTMPSHLRTLIFAALTFFAVYSDGLLGQELSCDREFLVTKEGRAPAVAVDGEGNFMVAWTRRSAYAKFYSFAGKPRSEELLLGEFPEQFAVGLSLSANDAGDFVAAWAANENEGQGAGHLQIHARILAPETRLSEEPIRVSRDNMNQAQAPAAAIDEWGRPLFLWMANSRIWGRRFDSTGEPMGERFWVSEGPEGGFPAVAMQPDGRFLAMWTTKDGGRLVAGVQARVFDDEGQPVSSEVRLNSFVGQQGRGNAAVDANGIYTAAWGGNGQEGRGLQVRQLDDAGVPIGDQIRLVPYDPDSEYPPSFVSGIVNVGASEIGNLAFIWMGSKRDLSGWDIFGQAWTSDLRPLSPILSINNTTEGAQEYPSAAMNGAGDLVVAWQESFRDPDDSWIKAATCRIR